MSRDKTLDELYERDMEREWLKSLPNTATEFPQDLRDMALDNVQKDLRMKAYELQELVDMSRGMEREFFKYQLKGVQNRISRGSYRVGNLDEIKQIPILDILKRRGIKFENTTSNRVRFKLRDEKTASAVAYLDSNSFYDFGSTKGGTVIDLIMELDSCSVSEAIFTLKGM